MDDIPYGIFTVQSSMIYYVTISSGPRFGTWNYSLQSLQDRFIKLWLEGLKRRNHMGYH